MGATPDGPRSPWVTILEVAKITGMEIGRITDLLKSGELPSHETSRTWLVSRAHAERLAARLAASDDDV